MDSIQTLDPNDPRAKQALLNLLGTTMASLKEIDRNVVGSSSNIRAQKTNLGNFANLLAPSQAPQPAPVPQYIPQQPTYIPTYTPPPAQSAPAPQPIATPNIDSITEKLDVIIALLNTLINNKTNS